MLAGFVLFTLAEESVRAGVGLARDEIAEWRKRRRETPEAARVRCYERWGKALDEAGG